MSEQPFTTDEITKMISDIHGDDSNAKLYALSHLRTIAAVLGPSRTIEELIPYTIEGVDYSNDAYCRMAAEFGTMINEVGGPSKVAELINPLKSILDNDENEIQETAIESLVQLAKSLDIPQFLANYIPLLKEFCENPWYPLRCAGAQLVCKLYVRFPQESQKEINSFVTCLSIDSSIPVRRSLAKAFVELIPTLTASIDAIISALKTLIADDAPAVGIELPKCLIALQETSWGSKYVVELSKSLFSSMNWQPRTVFLTEMHHILGQKPPVDFISKITTEGPGDPSVEIRNALARQIPYIKSTGCLNDNEFTTFVKSLSSDNQIVVRASTARSLGDAPIPEVIQTLLNDTELEVQMAALESVAQTGIGFTEAAKHLVELVKFSGWRVKKNITSLLPKIAGTMKVDDFTTDFLPLTKTLLQDEASEVRLAAIENTLKLAKVLGEEWIEKNLVPIIIEFSKSHDYQLRQVAIILIVKHGLAASQDAVLQTLSQDSVPNVRMVLARELPSGHQILELLAKDADQDVSSLALRK